MFQGHPGAGHALGRTGSQIGGILQAMPCLNKRVGAALLDAHNPLVAQVRELQAKELPPELARRRAQGG